jgi:hypothetical protein
MRTLAFLLCAALLAPALFGPAQAGQAQARAKKSRPQAAGAVEKPALSPEDVLSPYSSLLRQTVGPHPAPDQGAGQAAADRVQSNATSWKLDLSLTPREPEDDSPLHWKLERETLLDPVTREPLTPRADPLGARKSLEKLDLKGAADKLGGKAEVQVDILKF